MYRIPGIVDIEVSREQDTPEFRLKVDREKTVNSGAMTSNIVRTVGALVGGQAVTTYEDEDGDAVDVRVRLPEELRQDPAQVEQIRLSVPQQGGPVALLPIGGLVTYERADTPSQVDRTDLTREVVVSGNLAGTGPRHGSPEGQRSGEEAPHASRIPDRLFGGGRGHG